MEVGEGGEGRIARIPHGIPLGVSICIPHASRIALRIEVLSGIREHDRRADRLVLKQCGILPHGSRPHGSLPSRSIPSGVGSRSRERPAIRGIRAIGGIRAIHAIGAIGGVGGISGIGGIGGVGGVGGIGAAIGGGIYRINLRDPSAGSFCGIKGDMTTHLSAP